MRIDEFEVPPQAEEWVRAAFGKASKVNHGSFALVLDADQEGYVVKLTRSNADYQALVRLTGTSTHFPIVIKHAVDQVQGPGGFYHAVLMEKLAEVDTLVAAAIANHINVQKIGKNHPMGLLQTAVDMQNGKLPGYPASLAQAILALSEYARSKMLLVELNQRVNWGRRTDGTLVMFDLVHTRQEM